MLEEVFTRHIDFDCDDWFIRALEKNLRKSGKSLYPQTPRPLQEQPTRIETTEQPDLRIVLNWRIYDPHQVNHWGTIPKPGDIHVKYQFMHGNNGRAEGHYTFDEHTGMFLLRKPRIKNIGRFQRRPQCIAYRGGNIREPIRPRHIKNPQARERTNIIVRYGIDLLTKPGI